MHGVDLKKAPHRLSMDPHTKKIPLCVDLDGTLIHSDLLLETFLLLIKRNPIFALQVPFWLLKSKATIKAEIATRTTINVHNLPYNQDLLSWLYKQKASGRDLWLCTASNFRLAHVVAEHLQIFQGVLASSDKTNLSGSAKARLLVEKFGEKGYEYCGNCTADLAIWQLSQGAIIVNGNDRLLKKAERLAEITATFPKKARLIGPVLRSIRLYQWVKNILVFAPLIAAHQADDLFSLQRAITAFFAFSFCSSSVYMLNDMLDLEADRQHFRKRQRPFASGDLSLGVGLTLVPILLLGASAIAFSLPEMFWLILAGYFLLTLVYSFGLKRVVLLDSIALAGLYTTRIVAGAAAIQVPLSFWLLLFSVFIFLSLALVKRYAELEAMQRQGVLKAIGRGYHVDDLPILLSLGIASGYLCVLVLALYINSPAVEPLYRHPQVIWFLCVLLLYWISRVWLKAHRGEMHDDPLVFALKDQTSLIIGVLALITIVLAA
jgi:4-hydroxybenzoate polyprenyltransferase/phosphoserine phosphatase